ncbi:hypothetical protein Tco_0775183 [Tanacetum coccineum]
MTGNRSKLMNFMEKFIGSVRFGNDHLGAIMGYGDYVMGDNVISRVLLSGGDFGTNSILCRGYFVVSILKWLQKAYMLFEVIAYACYTQNDTIHNRITKPSYVLVHDKKPDSYILPSIWCSVLSYNDSENLGKFQAKADIGIFVGYAPSRKGYRIYNKRTRQLMETIHVTFDEMHQSMAPVRISSGPEPIMMTPGQLKSGLAPTDKELEMLFQPLSHQVHLCLLQFAQDAPFNKCFIVYIRYYISSSQHYRNYRKKPIQVDYPNHFTMFFPPSHNIVTRDPGSAQFIIWECYAAEPQLVNKPSRSLSEDWNKIILCITRWQSYRPESTRKQLASDALWCCFHIVLSKSNPRSSKGFSDSRLLFHAMQDEIHRI